MRYINLFIFILSVVCSSLIQGEESMSMPSVSSNICNLDLIYQEGGFNYSVPKKTLSSWLNGVGFGRDIAYSNEEMMLIEKDANAIFQNIINKTPIIEKEAIITCGAPGAGKTVLLEQILAKIESETGESLAYIDPDAVCLKNMTNTFGAQVESAKNLPLNDQVIARKESYNDWRPASNAINHLVLGHLIKDGIKFCLGTTATGDKTYLGFKALKDQGYKIRLIHLTASDEVRVESINHRDKQFIQTTDEDIVAKAKLFPQRIKDTYLKFADEIEFYYRDGVHSNAVLSAVWERDEKCNIGKLDIRDHAAYEKVKTWHDANLDGPEGLLWKNTVEKGLD